jgi:hypothetical protein
VEKEMTQLCFTQCFNKKKFVIDFDCVSICYHKYLFSINTIKSIVEDEGRKYHSDYVGESLGREKRDRFLEDIFPLGGHPAMGGDGPPLRRKFFESYYYSDPLKTGR